MLITRELYIIPSGNFLNYYRKIGYDCIINQKILIKIEDLPKGSKHIIEAKCDICESIQSLMYYNYNKCVDKIGIYTCPECKEYKKKLTNFKKFGYEYASQNPDIIKKIKESNLEKYGHECTLQNPVIKEKVKKTNLEKYGVEWSSQSIEVNEKIKKNNLEKYGVYYTLQLESVKEKIKKTNLEKYGVENVAHNEEILKKRINSFKSSPKKENGPNKLRELYENKEFSQRALEKREKTNLEKYGFINPSMTDKIKEKIKSKIIEKYGTISLYSLDEIKEKSINTKINNLIKKYNEKIGERYNIKSIDFISKNLIIEDKVHNNEFTITLNHLRDRLRTYTEISTIINPLYYGNKSGYEYIFVDFFNDLNIKYESSTRSIINPLELDFYLPDHKLAIEFNGLYWHSELFKDKKYHLNKTKKCMEKGIELMHFFEDDIQYKQDIIKSIIKNRLGIIENKIWARKCEIKEVSDIKIIKDFLDKNHIQGYTNSKINIGLYHNNELVSLMCFGYKYTTSKKEMELTRFCSKINTIVVGAAKKVFKYFTSKFEYDKIISYSDNAMFNGNMYKKLGFDYLKTSPPNYYWIVDKKRYHRFTFNKKSLIKKGYDKNKTEVEIMNELGYYRIWGVGQTSWIYNK